MMWNCCHGAGECLFQAGRPMCIGDAKGQSEASLQQCFQESIAGRNATPQDFKYYQSTSKAHANLLG